MSRFLLPLCLPLCLLVLPGASSAQNLNWRQTAGFQRLQLGNVVANTRGIYVDGSGNVYVTGYVVGVFDQTQVSAGGYDAFVVKYDSSGNQRWVQQFGSPSTDVGVAVTTDASGNVYVAGNTNGSLGGVANAGGFDVFVTEFDPNGNQLWIQQAGSAALDEAGAIVADADGNVYVAGSTLGSLISGTLNKGGTDILLLQYNQAGTQLWVEQFGSGGNDQPFSVAVDNTSGFLYIAGATSGNISIGGGTSYGGYDAFLAQYTFEGVQNWITQLGSAAEDAAYSVTVDSSANVYVAGAAGGSIAGTYPYAGGYDAFVAQYTSGGGQNWVQEFGTPEDDLGYSVVTDSNGNVYVSGTTYGALAPGAVNAGLGDVFVATYNASAKATGVDQFGGKGWDAAASVAFGPGGQIYVGGYTTGVIVPNQKGIVFLETLSAH
jgi:hypothetical protein